MHHGSAIVHRPSVFCFQSRKTVIQIGLRHGSSGLGKAQHRSLQQQNYMRSSRLSGSSRWLENLPSIPFRPFSASTPFRFQQALPLQKQIPARAPSELRFRRSDLGPGEVTAIFGANGPSPRTANALLKVLHSRRVNGTIDLELPPRLIAQLKAYPKAVDAALGWLRIQYPIDEDAAIIRRTEREEAGQGSEEYISRAENLGLYKPQSGSYEAPLGEDGDIFGRSQLQKLRRENELREEREEEELDAFIEQKQQAEEVKSRALEPKREDGLEVSSGSRPPNSFERWVLKHKLRATSKLTLQEASQMGKFRRLFPSFLFAFAVMYSCYLFGQFWTLPDRESRLMPSQPLSRATIFGIMGANVLIFLLWKFPPSWRMLNRNFISTPAEVRLLSHVGNVFSHVKLDHMAWNMVLLYLLGEPLHEQIGRGWFLAIYFASGVGGSVASLTGFVSRNVLVSSSLGASGAVSGVIAAFLTINSERKITSWLLPESWTEWLSVQGSTLLALAVVSELVSMTVPFLRSRTTDYAAHLGGYAIGILSGMLWKREHSSSGTGDRAKSHQPYEARWYEKYLGR